MKKLWSLSTTVRNAERILPFLRVLSEMEGEPFDEAGQIKYQTLLLQNRLYQPTKLTEKQLKYYEVVEDKMSFEQAQELFEHMRTNSKELQKSPGLRGRTSVSPLTKMGLAIAKKSKGQVVITDMGKALLNKNIDISDVFFKFFLKWQIPNPETDDYKASGGYNIIPFIGVIHLIDRINKKMIEIGEKPKGLSYDEFNIFVPTLVNHIDIDKYVEEILKFRKLINRKSKKEKRKLKEVFTFNFIKDFLQSDDEKIIYDTIKNLKEYGDNSRRYLHYTKFFEVRGKKMENDSFGVFNYFNLEPKRKVEIEKIILEYPLESQTFVNNQEYVDYMGDITQPELPWENIRDLNLIIKTLIEDIEKIKKGYPTFTYEIDDFSEMDIIQLKKLIEKIRLIRRDLQEKIEHGESQDSEKVAEYVNVLDNIYDFKDDRPIILEKYSTLGLNALNNALSIKPNYPVGDNNEPTFTAPANTPDIECYYEEFNSICEVTMLTGRDQWYNEGQPVMRHLRDFEDRVDIESYCLFIAPKLHRDTINTFWTAVKYEFEGEKQKIVPITISQFVMILKYLNQFKSKKIKFTRHNLKELYEDIISLTADSDNSEEWIQKIPDAIKSWGSKILI